MTYGSDDELLAELGRALAPDVRPSEARRAEVRVMASAGEPGRRSVPSRRRVSLGLAVGAIAAAAIVLAFGAGVVFHEDLPRPVRVAARALGLPIESPELVEARGLMLRLGVLVGSTERGEDTVAPAATLDRIEAIDARMLELVGKLDAQEKAKLVPVAHEVHLRAVQVLEESGRPQP
ncbi:MAG: hypothetical protein ACRDKJ_13375 [Actinomycetota bacterium]